MVLSNPVGQGVVLDLLGNGPIPGVGGEWHDLFLTVTGVLDHFCEGGCGFSFGFFEDGMGEDGGGKEGGFPSNDLAAFALGRCL